jgi:hypothetical protein
VKQRDGARATYNVELVLRGPDGEIKETRRVHNLIVKTGLETILEQLLDAPGTATPKYMAIGETNTAPAEGDTKLKKETSRKALSSKTRSGKVVTMKASWAAGEGTGALVEAGILSASSEGTLYVRAVFGTLTKEAADTLEAVWTLTLEDDGK